MKTQETIGDIWVKLKDRIKLDLSEASRIAITCDIWSSKLLTNSFIGKSHDDEYNVRPPTTPSIQFM